MDTAITGLIVIAVLLLAVTTISERYFSAQDTILESWQEMEERMSERARTRLSPVGAETKPGGGTVEVTLRNEGEVKLADFEQWDVILQYHGDDGCHVEWYPFGEWTVEGIYLDASETITETFEPNILNPGEEAVIWISVSPPVFVSSTNMATVATPNGITASAVFTR